MSTRLSFERGAVRLSVLGFGHEWREAVTTFLCCVYAASAPGA